jgi:peptide/nickel transport system ATP-binding protein
VTAFVEVRGLSVEYPSETGPVRAADGVSFSLPAGARLGLVGESGSGKTTTALGLLRLLRPPARVTAGGAMVDGVDLLALEGEAMRRSRLSLGAYVPQGAMNALNPVMTIGAQLADVFHDHDLSLSRSERGRRIAQALADVELGPEVAPRFAHELSGGMRQRVAIAIAFALSPKLVIADEPTSALDVVTQRQIMAMLVERQSRIRSTMILIGHDMGLMAQTATHLAVMYAGRLVEFGPLAEVFRAPAHPYTAALIEAVPTLGRRGAVRGIPGVTPSLKRLPPGCAFAPRCALRRPECERTLPLLRDLGASRAAACILAGDDHAARA